MNFTSIEKKSVFFKGLVCLDLYIASLSFSVSCLRKKYKYIIYIYNLYSYHLSNCLPIYLYIFARLLPLSVPLYHSCLSLLSFCAISHPSSANSFFSYFPYTYKHAQIFLIPKIRKARTISLLHFSLK